jgi:hypothetical protein
MVLCDLPLQELCDVLDSLCVHEEKIEAGVQQVGEERKCRVHAHTSAMGSRSLTHECGTPV